jgi:hypothetical protein
MNNRISRYLLITIIAVMLLACGITDLTSQFSPTATPIPPIETPLPSPTPKPESIPGWKKFEGGDIELWLPESFEGGDLSQDLDLILEILDQFGPEFDQVTQMISQNPEIFVIYAFDINPSEMGPITSVNVVLEQTLSAITVDDYIEAALNLYPSMMEVVKTETLTLNGYDAGIVELSYAIEGIQIHQIQYVFKQGGSFWVVTYSTSEEEYAQRLPEFEQSISTFKIKQ